MWLNFKKVYKNSLLFKNVHHLNQRNLGLQTYAKEKCFNDDEKEFTTMVNFSVSCPGHYHQALQHSHSAKWLIDSFGHVITIPDFDEMVRILMGTFLNCCMRFFLP